MDWGWGALCLTAVQTPPEGFWGERVPWGIRRGQSDALGGGISLGGQQVLLLRAR